MASNSTNESAPTKLCENCKKDVLVANYDMHSVHCQRFMKYCDYCNQSYSKNEWDEHVTTNHGEICCKDCGKLVAKRFIDEHSKQDCRFRTQACRYCDISLHFFKLAEHEDFCGSRTELCPGCRTYVKVRDLEGHRCEPGPVAPADREPDFGYSGTVDFDEEETIDDDFHDIMTFGGILRSCGYCNKLERTLGTSLEEHKKACPEQPVSCKYCPEKVPMLFLESHEAVCPGMVIVCPGCRENVRMEEIDRHSDTCRAGRAEVGVGPEASDLSGVRPEAGDLSGFSRGRRSPGASLEDFDGLGIKDGKVKLPCEFCHELFSIDMLIQHESGCERAGPYDTTDQRVVE